MRASEPIASSLCLLTYLLTYLLTWCILPESLATKLQSCGVAFIHLSKDCGAEPYRTHLLSMLQALADHLMGHSGGIVIDRQDFLGLVNPRADDGVTAYISPPAVPSAMPFRSTY